MLRISLWLCVGLSVCGFAFCSIKCPDGKLCPDLSTCCLTGHGFSCCPLPEAVCCSDKAHCCPSGYRCNLATMMCEKTDQPWVSLPMLTKEAAEEPPALDLSTNLVEELKNANGLAQKSTGVQCDSFYMCPDRTTCCRHPKGAWFCCPYYPGRCCLDGFHCCPYGYDCDLTYTHCIRDGFKYPFYYKQALTSVPAALISHPEENSIQLEKSLTALTEASDAPSEHGVIRCDDKFFCPAGSSCCKGAEGQWTCCPYPLGKCCVDGRHCCQYGYTCDATSATCRKLSYPVE
uniref:Granulins domain-containing protein n=1 Tax=Oryzias sinensis TaxID=183150 RepID=A0A8C7Y0Z3_9TELE